MTVDLVQFIAVGFLAQLVDGAIGMAYGVTSTTLLLSLGIAPVTASAGVHAAELVTTGVSGVSHLYFRNVQGLLFRRLALPGLVGAIVGATLLTEVPGETIRPFVALYLLAIGLVILRKVFRPLPVPGEPRGMVALGLCGGFFDALGGGGWGPIVTSTLIARGAAPRYAIGSANLAEFVMTAGASATFVAGIGVDFWPIALGLLIGGLPAAPLAGYLAKRMPARPLMALVAAVVIALSAHMIWRALWP